MNELFRRAAGWTSAVAGSPLAFLAAVAIVIVWWWSGPRFHYSDTWQLFINTGTTIGTFLMVFLIQNTQNRDAKAIQLKLDELIRSTKGARASFVNMEELGDDELKALQGEFETLRKKHASQMLNALHAHIVVERHRRGLLGPLDDAVKGALAELAKLGQAKK
ncbi:low affinity iron permease family protein [Candidatus Berkelbacteria bacterium]|nr:low affinity iron permease family protein [Candidatus Berkelbacteria bacterium]